jgi:VCBS repeat-containing protein
LINPGTYTLSLAGANEDAGATGDLDITGDLEVIGAGRDTTTINANRLDRIFDLDGTPSAGALRVALSGLTLTGGLTPTRVANYATGNDGGAIDVYRGNLSVADCIIRDNKTGTGTYGGNGGGIGLTWLGTLTVTNSIITANITGDAQRSSGLAGSGGGIYGNAANITITDSLISDNYGFDEAGTGTADALDSGAAPAANAHLLSGATRTASSPGGASRRALDLTADGSVINYATPGVDVNKIDALGSMTVTLWLNLRADPSNGDILLSDLAASGAPAGTGGWELRLESASGTPTASNPSLYFTVFERTSAASARGEGKFFQGPDANQKWVFLALTSAASARGEGKFFQGPDANQKWVFLALTFATDRTLRTYNASETAPVTVLGSTSLFSIPLRDNSTPLGIGGSTSLATTDHTPPAWMDDVRIYDRALSAAELEAVRQEDLVKGNGVLANDSDPEANPLTATLVGGPAHGTLALDADGTFSYIPNADYNGPDSFTCKVSDGVLESAPATVSITVTPANDAPVGAIDTYATVEDTPLTVAAPGLLGNDTDVDGDRLTATLVNPPTFGTVTINADGSFTYTPIPNAYTTRRRSHRATASRGRDGGRGGWRGAHPAGG